MRGEEPHLIPVTVLTGFLGSGKTTLLSRLLRDARMGRVAVIVNEFGAVGIDHELVKKSDETFVELTTGCLCCKVRSDLVLTLQDLAARRAAGALPAFNRVVIETSGLADPASILQALMTDAAVVEAYRLNNVVTTVDAVLGARSLALHAQCVRQAAVADTLVLTKTDLPEAQTGVLEAQLGELNLRAAIHHAAFGEIDPALLLEDHSRAAVDRLVRLGGHPAGEHAESIASTCFLRELPISAVALALFLEALAEHCGEGLLRMKGIVNIKEAAGRPAVVHGVQHVFQPPEWLAQWPSGDRRTRMVFIGRQPPSPLWVGSLLDLLDAEVAEVMAKRSHPA